MYLYFGLTTLVQRVCDGICPHDLDVRNDTSVLSARLDNVMRFLIKSNSNLACIRSNRLVDKSLSSFSVRSWLLVISKVLLSCWSCSRLYSSSANLLSVMVQFCLQGIHYCRSFDIGCRKWTISLHRWRYLAALHRFDLSFCSFIHSLRFGNGSRHHSISTVVPYAIAHSYIPSKHFNAIMVIFDISEVRSHFEWYKRGFLIQAPFLNIESTCRDFFLADPLNQ